MRSAQVVLLSIFAIGSTLPGVAATRSHHAATSKVAAKRTVKAKILGQRSIDNERAAEIQSALVKAGYLSGTPSGHWDAATQAAMQKVQADNGWQTKLVPDSRALIKLGLGPSTASSAVPGTPAAARAAGEPNVLAQK